MSQNTRHPSLSRKAGRGLLRALKGLFGGRTLRRAAESWDVLRAEYAAGRAETVEPPPRPVPHREIEPGAPSGPGTGAPPPKPPRAT